MILVVVFWFTLTVHTQEFLHRSSISGTTAFTGFDAFYSGSFRPADSLLHCSVLPTAFGNLSLTESALLLNVPSIELPVLVHAQTAGGWIKSSISTSLFWQPVAKLRLCMFPELSYRYAYSLLSEFDAGVRLLGSVVVDTTYSVAIAVSNINLIYGNGIHRGFAIHSSIAGKFLNWCGSIDVALQPTQQLQLFVVGVTELTTELKCKVELGTNPILIGATAQLLYNASSTISLGFQHTEKLGFSPVITLEFSP